jgi:hypothetical protein
MVGSDSVDGEPPQPATPIMTAIVKMRDACLRKWAVVIIVSVPL